MVSTLDFQPEGWKSKKVGSVFVFIDLNCYHCIQLFLLSYFFFKF